MSGLDPYALIFVVWSFIFQFVLIAYFALRKWFFDSYLARYGWVVYVLSVPAIVVSLVLLFAGKTWLFWSGGYLYLIWGIYGITIDYVKQIRWRSPILWRVFGPYVVLYLATVMFYWWPLGLISRPLWYVGAVLFVISTVLNVTSHRKLEGGEDLM